MLFYSSTPNPLGFGHPFLLKPNQQGTALSALQGGGGSTSEDRTTSQDAAAQIVAMLQNDATTRGDADWPNSWGKKGDGKGYSELAKADSKPSHLHGNVAVARHGKKKRFASNASETSVSWNMSSVTRLHGLWMQIGYRYDWETKAQNLLRLKVLPEVQVNTHRHCHVYLGIAGERTIDAQPEFLTCTKHACQAQKYTSNHGAGSRIEKHVGETAWLCLKRALLDDYCCTFEKPGFLSRTMSCFREP